MGIAKPVITLFFRKKSLNKLAPDSRLQRSGPRYPSQCFAAGAEVPKASPQRLSGEAAAGPHPQLKDGRETVEGYLCKGSVVVFTAATCSRYAQVKTENSK